MTCLQPGWKSREGDSGYLVWVLESVTELGCVRAVAQHGLCQGRLVSPGKLNGDLAGRK